MREWLLLYKQRMYFPQWTEFRRKLLELTHSNLQGGHSSYEKILQKAMRHFYWLRLKKDVKTFIRECDVCQRMKVKNTRHNGLLQPLLISSKPWIHIVINFVEDLPNSQGLNCLQVVVNKYTK